MSGFSLFQRTLNRALAIVGDERRLGRRLRVPIQDLQQWLTGEGTPPTWVFLSAVDVVVGAGKIRPVAYERRRKPREQDFYRSSPH
jgi:hypothetical protein